MWCNHCMYRVYYGMYRLSDAKILNWLEEGLFMSYSRWGNSTWYTYWSCHGGITKDSQLFSVDCEQQFRYSTIKELNLNLLSKIYNDDTYIFIMHNTTHSIRIRNTMHNSYLLIMNHFLISLWDVN